MALDTVKILGLMYMQCSLAGVRGQKEQLWEISLIAQMLQFEGILSCCLKRLLCLANKKVRSQARIPSGAPPPAPARNPPLPPSRVQLVTSPC